MTEMYISVVVPTFNRAYGLAVCLEALLAQDYPDYEIILSDDGSTDSTAEVAARYGRVHCIRGENRGPAAARNRGLVQARGEIVAFTDDDCRVPSDWLSRLAAGYARYPHVAGVGGYLDPPDAVVRRNTFARYERYTTFEFYHQGRGEVVSGLDDYPGGGASNMSYRKSVLDQVRGFDEWFPYAAAEDHDLRVRVHALGHVLLHLHLRVEHLRRYSWQSFRRQCITHGRGVMRWEYKMNKRLTSNTRILLRMGKRICRLVPDWMTFSDKQMAIVHAVGNWLDAYGQWLERRKLIRECE
jgi:glycosyltransferase involved in cell wall biosynthesis